MIIKDSAISKQIIPCPWNHLANPIAKVKAPIDEVKGHGLNSTR